MVGAKRYFGSSGFQAFFNVTIQSGNLFCCQYQGIGRWVAADPVACGQHAAVSARQKSWCSERFMALLHTTRYKEKQ
ncbi:MAG: hypothetical protein J0651_02195 [Actinobacteria bacterium]|nr:hypothetical protein [Actinomycetota bacterium]